MMISSKSFISRLCAWTTRLHCRCCMSSESTSSMIQDQQQHLVVTKNMTMNKMVAVVGDVHGCYDELQDMMNRLSQMSRDSHQELQVIFVGDLVGKGPDSVKVVQSIRTMDTTLPLQYRMVRGNHDDLLLSMIGKSGNEYADIAKAMMKDDIRFLESAPYSIFVEEYNTFVVHAGMKPGTKPEQNSIRDLITARDVLPDGGGLTSKANSVDGSKPWASAWNGPQRVVFGHDAARKLQKYPFATGLDTGCCYGGHLTALVLNSNELVQVPARMTYKKPGKNE